MAAPWSFIASYIGTALWSSCDDHSIPLDSHHDMSDLAVEAHAGMEADCHAFYGANHRHVHCFGAPLARVFDRSVHGRSRFLADALRSWRRGLAHAPYR